MLNAYLKRTLIATFCAASLSTGAFAEDAPVYDADSYPPQFDGQPADPVVQVSPSASQDQAFDAQDAAPQHDHAATEQAFMPQQSTQSMTMDQRVARVERQMNNMAQMDMLAKIGDMHNEIQSLRGQIDSLTHQLQQAQTQQKSMYADLDKRVTRSPLSPVTATDETTAPEPTKEATKPLKKSAAKAATTEKTTAVATATDNQPNVAEEQQIYQNAYNFIKAKKYSDAALQLQKMLDKYPTGQFAANAHYWLGELNSLMGKNEQAITEFSTVLKDYPDSPKLADAQLKLGLIYAGLFKWSNAKTAFKKVVNNYPGTASARLATEQLKQIKQAGH